MSGETLYGFYSAKAADSGYKIHVYESINGGEIYVTSVSSDPENSRYKWDDKVFVGVVTKYLRTIKR